MSFIHATTGLHHSSHSMLAADSGESQYAGNPATADVPATFAISPLSEESRSAML